MFKVDVRRALDILSPRYNPGRATWPLDGKLLMFNIPVVPDRVVKYLTRLVDTMFDDLPRIPVRYVDVTGTNLWALHRSLKVSHVMYFMRKGWSWQKWKVHRLPTYVIYNGRLIIYNGTHRTLMGRLACKRIRGRVYDIDKWRADKRKSKRRG